MAARLHRRIRLFVFLLLGLAALAMPAHGSQPAAVNAWLARREQPPPTLYLPTSGLAPSLDPARVVTPYGITISENLFLGLTDLNPQTNAVRPELAIRWHVSPDGRIWTFTLRDDVQWVAYDPASESVDPVRPVVAEDVVYGIKRLCDPRITGYQKGPLTRLIDGCDTLREIWQPDLTDSLVYGDTVRVSAPDDTTVVIHLTYPAQHFLSVSPLLVAMPREVIEAAGAAWTAPGTMLTNGPFYARSVAPGQEYIFVRNPHLPLALLDDGNVEQVIYQHIADPGTRLALYDANTLDQTDVGFAYVQAVLSDPAYREELVRVFSLDVFYFGFAHYKQPFDDVQVRRAFSAIIDRQAFVDRLRQGRGVPMIQFTPPSVPYAPDLAATGVGFDPAYARAELAAAGYPRCEGLPPVVIATYPGTEAWGTFLAESAEAHLGCDSALFTVEAVVSPLFVPEWTQANVWTAGWRPSYPDAHNWAGDALFCENGLPVRRPCDGVDDLIAAAATEPDPAARTDLYAQIEGAFFGPAGTFPIAPLYVEAGAFMLVKPWLSGPFEHDGQYGGLHWSAYSIDMETRRLAREES